MCEVRPAILVGKSNMQLVRYSVDICQILHILTDFEVSQTHHRAPEFSHNLVDYTICFIINSS